MLRERQRQFPCMVPSAGQGHTFYDLTALWLGKTVPRPQHISCSAPVVLFGTAQEGPNMEAGWRPEDGMEPAKRLWSTSRVSPGRHNTSPHPSCREFSVTTKPEHRDRQTKRSFAHTKWRSFTCKGCRASVATAETAVSLICWQAAALHRCTGYRSAVRSCD